MKMYEVTFDAIQSYYVSAKDMKEAEEKARKELDDDLKVNTHSIFEVHSIIEKE